MRLLQGLVLTVAVACSSGQSEDGQLEQRATQAMAALNRADAAFPDQIATALHELGSDLLVRRAAAADAVETKVLPLVDTYLATLDRAVSAADAYLATVDDPESKRSVEAIRKRADGLRKARGRFAELAQRARAGASAEEISQSLLSIGTRLSVGL